jgi:hypothetical protein
MSASKEPIGHMGSHEEEKLEEKPAKRARGESTESTVPSSKRDKYILAVMPTHQDDAEFLEVDVSDEIIDFLHARARGSYIFLDTTLFYLFRPNT